jgi:hypothetical protein
MQIVIGRLIENGSCFGVGIIVGKTKAMRISREPFALQIMIYQKQLDNMEYFNNLGGMTTIMQDLVLHVEVNPGF